MRILVLADQESKYFWDYFQKQNLDGIDLIISCGDLEPTYLSFLATFTTVPVLYVHGNHDDRYESTAPEGCICIEDTIYKYNGLRILGLGGSKQYSEGHHQYTEWQLRKRAFKLLPKLMRHRGFDILVTHAPAEGFHDGPDQPHMGFAVFRRLLDKYTPKYFLHGHVHLNYGRSYQRISQYNEHTTVINAFEYYIFETDI